jgi:sterol desaturase/sphingolipid hydroxylase (fatty acid hydroxylase superfamily)
LLGSAFLGLGLLGWFAALAAFEFYCARRSPRPERSSDHRLLTNFAFGAVIFAAGVVVPISKVGASAVAQSLGAGIAPKLGLSWPEILLLLLVADSFAVYSLHRLMHRTPLLWRIHRVHHTDLSVDVSTTLRNHPLELLVSLPMSAAVVLIVGAPASIIIAAQTMEFAATIWQHADIDLPRRVDRAIALVLVTPRVHRLHHNPERQHHDSNYGEFLTLWDRLFGTFNKAEGRQPVGLEGQIAQPDRLLQQIWSPVYGA